MLIFPVCLLLLACGNNSKKLDTEEATSRLEREDVNLNEKTAVAEEFYVESQKLHFKDIPFYRELLSRLDSEHDTVFIYPRHLLDRFDIDESHDSVISLVHKQFRIDIISKDFESKRHSLDLVDTVRKANGEVDYLISKNIIDNTKAYGIDGNMPKTEISDFTIKINQKSITLHQKHVNDIYNINLQTTEAYFDSRSGYIYVYISGSDAAGSYSAKYVFDENGYITRIIAELCGFDFIDGLKYNCS